MWLFGILGTCTDLYGLVARLVWRGLQIYGLTLTPGFKDVAFSDIFDVQSVFCSDTCPHVRAMIQANFKPLYLFDSCDARPTTVEFGVDIYVAGFPCQPFSLAGLKESFKDRHERGNVIWNLIFYIDQRRPRLFILENVANLKDINGGADFRKILQELESIGDYNIHHQILSTLDHGIPQSRPRLFIVGIRKWHDDGSFHFPEPLGYTPAVEDQVVVKGIERCWKVIYIYIYVKVAMTWGYIWLFGILIC